MKFSKNIFKKALWVLLACFVVYTFYFLWEQSQPKPDVYELLNPTQRNIQQICVATGSIESRKQIEVKPRATGTIKQLCVTIGQEVEVGQTIAIIETYTKLRELARTIQAVNDHTEKPDTVSLQKLMTDVFADSLPVKMRKTTFSVNTGIIKFSVETTRERDE